MSPRGRTAAFVSTLAVMVALSTGVQFARDRISQEQLPDAGMLYVKSSHVMQKAALSYDALLADFYWIRAIQHYGRERLKRGSEANFSQLYPLLDIATTLDPRFVTGYRFGAIFLSEPHPGGAGRPDLAITLLKKGIAYNPGKWDYYHDIGFIYYWNLQSYEEAAHWFKQGAEVPGAPWWLRTYAAVMLTRRGDRASSRTMWNQIAQTEGSEWLRRTAELRLAQLDALDQIDTLERMVAQFSRGAGGPPSSWEQMVSAGMLRSVPTDPTGTPYTLIPSTGDVTVAVWSPLHPLPTEPSATPELKAPAR